MESNLVAEFVSKTGASSVEAHSYLQARGWNLQLAIKDYLNKEPLCNDGHSSGARPLLIRGESVDMPDSASKRLSRGISRATDNIHLVSKARSELGLDLHEKDTCLNEFFIETPVFTFTLPDLTLYPDDFRQFLEKDLIEQSSLVSLEQAGRLNWWADNGVCQRLWPLATTGDGNCLLHAASLGMWGFHDRLLTLRKALHEFLSTSECRYALWRRWRLQQSKQNIEAGLVLTEEEWRKDWNEIVSMASSTPRNYSGRRRSLAVDRNSKGVPENAVYEGLEEIHVLALSHVLRRPIIVIADTMLKDVHGDALAPILFGGIYLPLETLSSQCHRSPLVLTYDAAHFSALVVMDKEAYVDKSPNLPAVIPITDSQYKLLPVQFIVDPGEHHTWGTNDVPSPGHKDLINLIKEYLDIEEFPIPSTPSSEENGEEYDCDTPCDEEDIDKRFAEADNEVLDEMHGCADTGLFNNKSKAAKQLQSVAKSFGSIGKSMSKKLKKNLGTITKMTRNNSQKRDLFTRSSLLQLEKTQDSIICAKLHTEARHEYQEEMIRNYLQTARTRFERSKATKSKTIEDPDRFPDQGRGEGLKNCITPACTRYGTDSTSYLCPMCYEKQKQQELSSSINSPSLPRAISNKNNVLDPDNSYQLKYGTGKSTFYLDASPRSHEAVKNMSSIASQKVRQADETLYLSNSTFFNDCQAEAGYYVKDWESSPAAANRNYSSPDFSDHPKSWQAADITNKIDSLGTIALPGGFSMLKSTQQQKTSPILTSKSPNNEPNANNIRKVQSYNLAREALNTTKQDTTTGNKSTNIASLRKMSGTSTTSLTSQSSQNSCDLPDIENVTRISSQQKPKQTKSNVIRIPISVETSKQNLNEEMEIIINDSTEYLNKNTANTNKANKIPNVEEIIKLQNGIIQNKDKTHDLNKAISKNKNSKCLNVTCDFYGNPELENYCSKCYRGRFELSGYGK